MLDTTCYDEERCTTQKNCNNIETQFSCPVSCGLCEATCKDSEAFCFRNPSYCTTYASDFVPKCPKTCGTCDVCEDLVKTEHCKKWKTRCSEDLVLYSCKKTCGTSTCKDSEAFCFRNPSYCTTYASDFVPKCPKTCGTCDVCEDLVKTEHCKKWKTRCSEDLVLYSCKKTCGTCSSTK
ncbi:unnamed protein product [Lepeophtheirus salmonis]|uniref:(salmon louse) hypothetical protein n=1 Tax=Lepeophtheirus salmonis TaxID=72036 RepID=A0A7R8D5L9_LEPSM|nr:unnamed protein product [Lepeophtheirus salmonis]CAF3031539.1 unnamed protein product [Lepeophtheirus salmonis]